METTTLKDLEEAGFTAAVAETKRLADLKRRMVLAYEHYRYVTPEQINHFNTRLRAETRKRNNNAAAYMITYDTLRFRDISVYPGCPPADVIQKVKEAKAHDIFDSLEVADIESVVEYVDPIIFGRIHGCDDRFYIAQWGDDVNIDDILPAHAG